MHCPFKEEVLWEHRDGCRGRCGARRAAVTDVPEAAGGRPRLLPLLFGVLLHQQVCPVCPELYLPYPFSRVAGISWWTSASCLLEVGLGGDKLVFKISHLKVCSALFLLVAAVCLPLCDTQFDPNGYLWALIHLICVGAYRVFHKLWKPNSLSDLDQQYINYVFSVVLLASASHPAGDLFSALDFPFLYFYRFHSSCCASGLLGFFLMLHTVKLKSSTTSGQYAAWSFLAKVITAGLSPFFFAMTANVLTISCLVISGVGEALLVYTERTGT
ncbi:transmembrane protein 241 isoform X7 [Coturnix japonica]|uniref:transmembrane protein 241 isoform X7 n=1 Tax=Coturnix japonica TaxID=93934 RepID=UPI000776FFE7|nr:transmembrane protein 241 isoform X7 [Coturnix japonica]